MKKENILKFIGVIIALVVIASNSMYVYATSTKTQLNSQLDETDKRIDETNEHLDEVKTEMSAAMQEIQKLSSEIAAYEEEIEDLDVEIEDLEKSIKEQEENLAKEEKNYEEQDEKLKKRIVALYEAGETSYLDVLLSSEDITTFISNYYLISEIAQADTEMLQEIEDKKNSIQAAKDNLEAAKEKIEAAKESKVKTTNALTNKKAEKDKQVKELSAEEKKLQEELDQFEKDKKSLQAELKKIADEEAKKNQVTISKPSQSGYISPIRGTTSKNITCGINGYPGHGGVDFGGHYGEAVLAVKDGTVVKSMTMTGTIPNYDINGNYIGSYSSYGEVIAINHHDGTITLYAHGKPGSRLVKVGDEVKQGQQIMSVGNTGNVRPRPTPSNPKGGAHLHFEVQVNGSRVNPAPYLP